MAKCEAKETEKAAGSTKSKKETEKAGDSAVSPLWPAVIAITKAKEEAEKAGGSIRPTIPMDARKETAKKKDQERISFTRNELWVNISEEMHDICWHEERRPWSQRFAGE